LLIGERPGDIDQLQGGIDVEPADADKIRMVAIHGDIITLIVERIKIMPDPVFREQHIVDPVYPRNNIVLIPPEIVGGIFSTGTLIQWMLDTPKKQHHAGYRRKNQYKK